MALGLKNASSRVRMDEQWISRLSNRHDKRLAAWMGFQISSFYTFFILLRTFEQEKPRKLNFSIESKVPRV
jgi:hypothetical protein